MAVDAVLAAGAAVWVTLNADFLANPGWLAAQRADFILGPVLVGLYWRRVRPESRFGLLLIGFGAVGAVYILQSSSNPWLFGIALHWEDVIYLVNLVLILTFPTGRLDGLAAKLILFAAVVAVVVPYTVVITLVRSSVRTTRSRAASHCARTTRWRSRPSRRWRPVSLSMSASRSTLSRSPPAGCWSGG